MKITVVLSDSEMREILNVSGEKKKGPAIRKVVLKALQLEKRRAMSEKVVDGEWSVDFPSVEKLREERTLWRSSSTRRSG